MARRTRYNELLGLPNELRDPDLYQLLGLDRAGFEPAAVDGAYKEQMRKLQAIRSPKHKAFIEFLKGELRRARTALSDPRRRADYDAELLEERREQLSLILDVVLADGVLSPAEEERIGGVAADVGLTSAEASRLIDLELRERGARRGDPAELDDWGGSAPSDPSAKSAPSDPSRAASGHTERPQRAASRTDIRRAIEQRLRPTPRRAKRPAPRPATPARAAPPARPDRRAPSPPRGPEEAVTAELVRPAPAARAPDESRTASEGGNAAPGWGQAAKDAKVGVCAGCLEPVTQQILAAGRAERLADGRLHCPACTNQLVAGLVCGLCYQRITRADMKGKDLTFTRERRVVHGSCARGGWTQQGREPSE